MPHSHRRFCLITVLAIGSSLGILAMVNLAVDPADEHRSVAASSLSKFRDHGSRKAKYAILAATTSGSTLLLGSSRVECAFDPAWPCWNGHAVNLGLTRTNAEEMSLVLDRAIEAGHVGRLYLFLDFSMFCGSMTLQEETRRSRFTGPPGYDDRIAALIGGQESGRSLDCLMRWGSGSAAPTDGSGFRWGMSAPAPAQAWLAYRARPTEIHGYSSMPFSRLRSRLARLVELKTEIAIAIMPVHASELARYTQATVLPDYERFLHDMTELTGLGPTFDFSRFDPYACEPVPSGTGGRMAWWYDPSHCRPQLGRLIATAMTGSGLDDGLGIDGATLSPTTLHAHFERLIADREAWMKLAISEPPAGTPVADPTR